MPSAKTVGRVMGLLFLVQGLLAPLVNFRWMTPATAPGFLANAAGSALQIRAALLLSLLLGGLTLSAAIMALPVFRQYSERMALLYVSLTVVGLSTLAMEGLAMRGMLSVSLEYAKAGAPNDLYQAWATLARTAWREAHFTNLMVAHATVFLLDCILFRFALVPRTLAALAMAAALLSAAAVLMPLLGYRFMFLTLIPTALTQLALILWLIVRGLEDHPRQTRLDVSLA